MVIHGQKWSKMVTNDKNGKRWSKMVKMVKSCQKLSKAVKNDKISNNSQKNSKNLNFSVWVTLPEHPKGTRDEVKQAWRAQSRLIRGPSVVPSSGPGVRPAVCPVRNWGTAGPQTSSWLYLSKNNLVISNVNLYSALLSSIKSKFCIEWNLHSSMNYIQGSDR